MVNTIKEIWKEMFLPVNDCDRLVQGEISVSVFIYTRFIHLNDKFASKFLTSLL